MNPRSTQQQLDFSNTSFPTLGGGGQAQASGVPSSQWQAGPPPREQTQSQNARPIQPRQQQGPVQREQNYSGDFSTSVEPPAARFQSSRAPPGLAPVDNMSPEGSLPTRKTPISQTIGNNIGQERSISDNKNQSPASTLPGRSKDPFAGPETISSLVQQDHTMDAVFSGMSEKDKWGMAGWQALNEGPLADMKAAQRQAEMAAFEHSAASGQPLTRSYAGPFAPPGCNPPRPLDSDYSIPECYVVLNVAPIQQRISGFTEDTLFYIFYTSPKDIIQEEVATELMSRKWRFHMKEKMWLTRDDTTQNPSILEKDVAEQGVYIWWDPRAWKRVRKLYNLRYEDLDDHLSGGRSLPTPGLFQGGFGVMAGMNGRSGFNPVPNLERAVAQSGRF